MTTYPIQTGPSAPTTTFLLASQLGLALNCDLITGLDKTTGAAAADDGPTINAAMAGATADNPLCLVMDGSACVSGLKLPAGGHWSIVGFGSDTGFYIAAGTNNHGIQNGSSALPANNGGVAAPARGLNCNVTIRDIFLNGNKGNGTNGNSTTGSSLGNLTTGWYFNIYLTGLNGIRIENVRSYNSPSFHLTLQNCGDWIVDGCYFSNALYTVADGSINEDNSDGIHVFGPSNDGRISNCFFRTGDDPIAFNACEGYGGLITRMNVVNCVVDGAMTMGRIYTGSGPAVGAGAQPLVDGVSFTNYQGNAFGSGLIIGNGAASGTAVDSITNVSFTNCRFTAPNLVQITDSVGTLTFDNCDWISGIDLGGGGVYPPFMILGFADAVQVSALTVNNCRAIRNPSSQTPVSALLGTVAWAGDGAGTIAWKRVTVNGWSVVDIGGYSGAAVAGLLSLATGSTLGHLQLDAVDASNIAALAASGTVAPATVAGGGVLQTGWAIADAAMAKWTPYLSAASGLPSYKNAAGTVVTL